MCRLLLVCELLLQEHLFMCHILFFKIVQMSQYILDLGFVFGKKSALVCRRETEVEFIHTQIYHNYMK